MKVEDDRYPGYYVTAAVLAEPARNALKHRHIRVQLLEAIAAAVEQRRDEVIAVAGEETSLTPDELSPEFDRMTGTLRTFAALIRDGSWVRASIDTPSAAGSIGPNHDLRKMLVPLGAVGVFGASNFPLAYGVCGGDTASALAAGCQVIVKEHPAHPKTGRLTYSTAQSALKSIGVQWNVLAYEPNLDPKDFAPAEALIKNDRVHAIGFTGSTAAGRAIMRLAFDRPNPVPVFAEMGSANPIFISGHVARTRPIEIADAIADSVLQRHGQQCTCPGLVICEGSESSTAPFVKHLATRISTAPARRMLAPWIHENYLRRCREIESCTEVQVLARGQTRDSAVVAPAMLFATSFMRLSNDASLKEEIFGPAAIVCQVDDSLWNDLNLNRSLAASLWFDPDFAEDGRHLDVEGAAWYTKNFMVPNAAAGRLTFNSVPTGVRVCTSMVHGGPFPATNRPDTTAVGPLAIERWCRPVCFQNCPDALLPPELQDANPMGIWRTVNGQPTRDPIRRGQ
jgi:NADP-dependent aldehyde dehydrogenase